MRPLRWAEWPETSGALFEALRFSAWEALTLEKIVFVERILPGSIFRKLSKEEMAEYRRPFAEPDESRRATLTWPREIPLDGEPTDVSEIVANYAEWLHWTPVPKLLVDAEPGAILSGFVRGTARRLSN